MAGGLKPTRNFFPFQVFSEKKKEKKRNIHEARQKPALLFVGWQNVVVSPKLLMNFISLCFVSHFLFQLVTDTYSQNVRKIFVRRDGDYGSPSRRAL